MMKHSTSLLTCTYKGIGTDRVCGGGGGGGGGGGRNKLFISECGNNNVMMHTIV